MQHRLRYLSLWFAGAHAWMSGCATVQTGQDVDRLESHVQHAIGSPLICGPGADAVAEERLKQIMADGLTSDDAAEVALLNNPRLQAQFLSIGIGRADVVQAGLFSNPALTLSLRWPDGGGLTNLEMGLAQNIAELWQIPIRRQSAERELERTILDMARTATLTALSAKEAYFSAVQADGRRDVAREYLAITQQLVELAVARRDAGSGSEVDINLARSRELQAEVDTRNAELAAIESRAELAKLLGLTESPGKLALIEPLPEAPALMLTVDEVIASARANRLDFRAVGESVVAARARVDLERTRFVRSIELGVSAERSERGTRGDRNWLAETAWASAGSGQLTLPSLQPRERMTTDWVVGPTLGVEIPIFDQNQARIARAEFEYQQAVKAMEALDREVVQDAHIAFERARIADENARFYRERFLPLQAQSLKLAQEAYRGGRTTVLTVLEAQRDLLSGRSGYVEVLRAAAAGRIALERVAGRPIAEIRDESTPPLREPNPGGSP